ncbi:hypothetical protein ACP4OV_015377 [Aristida adscensionis]
MPPFLLRWKRKRLPPERRRRRGAFKRKQKPELRIDRLPQDIIDRILSFLPMKDAARTSVLSSKWQQGWASYPKLTLNSETMLSTSKCKVDCARKVQLEQYRMKFIENVNTIMRQRHGFGVEEFVLKFRLIQRDVGHLDRWFALAATARLERLAIDLNGQPVRSDVFPEEYAFSLQLLENKGGAAHLRILQLTKLSLKPLAFTPPGAFTCGTLVENLQIEAINLRTISHGYNVGNIVVRKDSQVREVKVDMNIPLGDYFGGIYYKDTLQYMFTGLPSSLPCLEKLSLNISEDIKTTNMPKCVSKLVHLRHLTLNMYLSIDSKFDILRLFHVVEAAPFLQHFELNVDEYMLHLYDDEPIPSLPRHPHGHLKWAAFQGFLAHKDMVALALYILRNAESLELMAVQTAYRYAAAVEDQLARSLRRKPCAPPPPLLAGLHAPAAGCLLPPLRQLSPHDASAAACWSPLAQIAAECRSAPRARTPLPIQVVVSGKMTISLFQVCFLQSIFSYLATRGVVTINQSSTIAGQGRARRMFPDDANKLAPREHRGVPRAAVTTAKTKPSGARGRGEQQPGADRRDGGGLAVAALGGGGARGTLYDSFELNAMVTRLNRLLNGDGGGGGGEARRRARSTAAAGSWLAAPRALLRKIKGALLGSPRARGGG